MRTLMLKLWNDDRGALIATEWVFAVTIMVIGLAVGLKAVQSAVVTELEDIANAVGALSQEYQFGGVSGCNNNFARGSAFTDAPHNTRVTTSTADFKVSSSNDACNID